MALLIQLGQNEMAAYLQTEFPNALHWIKSKDVD